MKVAGIVCECNPLHGGHLYLMDRARRGGADAVVCVMSGCFTQRGEAAILDPLTRAEMLLRSQGADAVFELPFPHSAAGADYFAAAGISLLDRLGVDEVWFGSECGQLEPLQRAAEITLTDSFAEAYRQRCRNQAEGTAEGYLNLLRELGGMGELGSNDLLGISYLKAMMLRNSPMKAVTVKRLGSGYHETSLTDGEIPSASALRNALRTDGIQAWKPYLPEDLLSIVEERIKMGTAPADLQRAERGILSCFRLIDHELLEKIPELSGGLGRRIAAAAHTSVGLEELVKKSVTKKYTEARVRRGILFAMTGISEDDLRREPAYAVLLAANSTGCRFLAERKKIRTVAVVTCHGDLPASPEARRQERLTEAAFALYGLTLPTPQATDLFLRRSSKIFKGES